MENKEFIRQFGNFTDKIEKKLTDAEVKIKDAAKSIEKSVKKLIELNNKKEYFEKVSKESDDKKQQELDRIHADIDTEKNNIDNQKLIVEEEKADVQRIRGKVSKVLEEKMNDPDLGQYIKKQVGEKYQKEIDKYAKENEQIEGLASEMTEGKYKEFFDIIVEAKNMKIKMKKTDVKVLEAEKIKIQEEIEKLDEEIKKLDAKYKKGTIKEEEKQQYEEKIGKKEELDKELKIKSEEIEVKNKYTPAHIDAIIAENKDKIIQKSKEDGEPITKSLLNKLVNYTPKEGEYSYVVAATNAIVDNNKLKDKYEKAIEKVGYKQVSKSNVVNNNISKLNVELETLNNEISDIKK